MCYERTWRSPGVQTDVPTPPMIVDKESVVEPRSG